MGSKSNHFFYGLRLRNYGIITDFEDSSNSGNSGSNSGIYSSNSGHSDSNSSILRIIFTIIIMNFL